MNLNIQFRYVSMYNDNNIYSVYYIKEKKNEKIYQLATLEDEWYPLLDKIECKYDEKFIAYWKDKSYVYLVLNKYDSTFLSNSFGHSTFSFAYILKSTPENIILLHKIFKKLISNSKIEKTFSSLVKPQDIVNSKNTNVTIYTLDIDSFINWLKEGITVTSNDILSLNTYTIADINEKWNVKKFIKSYYIPLDGSTFIYYPRTFRNFISSGVFCKAQKNPLGFFRFKTSLGTKLIAGAAFTAITSNPLYHTWAYEFCRMHPELGYIIKMALMNPKTSAIIGSFLISKGFPEGARKFNQFIKKKYAEWKNRKTIESSIRSTTFTSNPIISDKKES